MATQSAPASRAGKYVTFQISRHYFALEANRVRQVTPARDVLPYEHSLECFRGILVVRGRRVPVIDIRERLGLGVAANHPRATVMLVETNGICGLPAIGVLVDKMTDVVEFRDRDFRENVIQQRPNGRPYGRPKTLLQLEGLLSEQEIVSLKSVF